MDTIPAAVSRDDLRQELNSFLVETCGKELKELGAKVLKDVQQELRSFIDEHTCSSSPSNSRHLQGMLSPSSNSDRPNTRDGLTGAYGIAANGELKIASNSTGLNEAEMMSAIKTGRKSQTTEGRRNSKDDGRGSPGRRNSNDDGRGSPAHSGRRHSKDDAPPSGGASPNGSQKLGNSATVAPLRDAGNAQGTMVPGQVANLCWVDTGDNGTKSETPIPTIEEKGEQYDDSPVESEGNDMIMRGSLTDGSANNRDSARSCRSSSVIGREMISAASMRLRSSLESPTVLAQHARTFVEHVWFDYVFGTLLIMNGIVIGSETNYIASSEETSSPAGYKVLNVIFCIAFTTELTFRLMAYRRRLYTMRGWQWNVFDTIVVGIQIADELTNLFFMNTGVQDVIQEVGVVRILRLGRVVRLVRMVRLIPELKSMVYLIFASMSSFLWAMVLIVLLMYCVAVYYTDTADKLAKEVDTNVDVAELKKYWASVERSMLSLFQAITGGNDWHNFIDCFNGSGDSTFVINALAFSLYVSFGMLVMLNLVTGVFVEGAQRIVKRDKDAELMRTVCKVFGAMDDDQSMNLSYDEFMSHLHDGSLEPYFAALELSTHQAKGLFALLDLDGNEVLSLSEFVNGCMRLRGPARAIDLQMLSQKMGNLMECLRQSTEAHAASATAITSDYMAIRKGSQDLAESKDA